MWQKTKSQSSWTSQAAKTSDVSKKSKSDEWREWYAGYQARLDEIKEAVSGMREEVSRRNADLERQKRERAAELNMSLEEYENYLKSLIIS